MRLLPFAAVLCALAVALVAGEPHVRANGVPQLVKLTYLAGVSDFGPRDAEGVLEFSFAEAYARVDVKNLPPQEGFVFEGWMLGSGDRAFRVGELKVDASGIGTLETKLNGLDGYDYDLFVVAARPEAAAAGAMPARKSIAGRFAVIQDGAPATRPGDTRPATLPDTGERPATGAANRPWLMIAAAASAAGLAAIGIHYLRRGNTHD